jgi:hypothetical protein
MTKPSFSQLLTNPLLTPQQSQNPSDLAAARNTSQALPSAFQGLDLLLVHQPPPSLSLMSPSFSTSGISLAESAGPIEEILKKGRPRYMFWSDGEGFWEREPFGWTNAGGREERWTRSVKLGSLGAEGEGKKARVSTDKLCVVTPLMAISGSTHSPYPLKRLLRPSRPNPRMQHQIPMSYRQLLGRRGQHWRIRGRCTVDRGQKRGRLVRETH